jgi:peptide/nickel transport system permease protein
VAGRRLYARRPAQAEISTSMLRYLIRRLLLAFLTILGVATIVFASMRLVPGGFIQALAGPNVSQTPGLLEALEEKYGLNQPVLVQYVYWLGNALQGDLGESLGTKSSVSHEIVRRSGVTIELTILATLVSMLLGMPAGVFAALNRRKPLDGAIRVVSMLGLSIPDFVLGTLLIYFVSTRHIGIPVSGYVGVTEDVTDHLLSMLLPTISLGLIITSIVMRVTRASVLEIMNEPYVTTARAKGLSQRRVARQHVVRPALIPLVTIVGINTGYLLSGAVIVEELFSLPGLGRYALQGILNRDYPVAQGAVLAGAIMFVFANLVADVLYAYVDPRIKY